MIKTPKLVLQNISWLYFWISCIFTNAIWRINEYLIYDEKIIILLVAVSLSSCAEMQQVMNQFPQTQG
jgi:hypothetical protein